MVIYLCLGKNVKFITFMIFTKNLKPMCTKVFCICHGDVTREAKKCGVVIWPKDWIRTFNEGHWLSFFSYMKFNTLTKFSISED